MTRPLTRWCGPSRDENAPVTELLSTLREPAPMRDDLVERIAASLQEERRRVGPRRHVRPVGHRADRRGPSSRLVLGLAGAAAALAFVGAAGVHALTPGPGGAAHPSVAADGPAMHAFLGPSSASEGASPAGATPAAAPRIEVSTTRYTDAGLVAQAAALLRRAPRPMPTLAAGAAGIGPLGSEIGVRECLTRLGLGPTTPATVDLALYRGRPAAVLVTGGDGAREVRVVPRNCGAAGAGVLTGPRHVG